MRGDDGANRLTLSGRSTVNGNINLGAGDDTLTIADNNVRINGQHVNLGAGNDTVHLGQPGRRAHAGSEPITVHYTLEGAENLAVHQASRLTADAKVRTNTITLNQADLTYQIDNNDQHALYDANRTSDVTLRGNGKLLIDTYQNDQAEREINIGGSGKLLSEGGVQTASTNHMQTATLADGKIKIAPRVAVQPGQSVNAQPNSTTNGTTANNTGAGTTNRVTTNNTTTGTTANAANNNTATNTVGSLVRLNRNNDAASATFAPPTPTPTTATPRPGATAATTRSKTAPTCPTAPKPKKPSTNTLPTPSRTPPTPPPLPPPSPRTKTPAANCSTTTRAPCAKAKPTPPSAAASPATTL